MSNRVRGNKRKELINKWLNGEEDEEYEIRPTKTEGKFIIKKRPHQVRESKKSEEGGNEDQRSLQSLQRAGIRQSRSCEDQRSLECKESEESERRSTEPTFPRPEGRNDKKESKKERNNNESRLDQSIGAQILEQLRFLGEEQRRREERKERKRETKMMVRKQLFKQNTSTGSNACTLQTPPYAEGNKVAYVSSPQEELEALRRRSREEPEQMEQAESKVSHPIYVRRRLNLINTKF